MQRTADHMHLPDAAGVFPARLMTADQADQAAKAAIHAR